MFWTRNRQQTRPALSGNNIHFSGRHFLRSDKEIPPLIKCGKENTLTYFLSFVLEGNGDIKENNTNTASLFFFFFFFLVLGLKQLVFIYSIITSV